MKVDSPAIWGLRSIAPPIKAGVWSGCVSARTADVKEWDSHMQFLLVRAANSRVVANPEARNSARNAARSPTSSDSSTPVCKLESKLLRMIVGRRRELKAKLRASSFSCDPRIFFGRASFCLYD